MAAFCVIKMVTRCSAVGQRLHDASCLPVVSYNCTNTSSAKLILAFDLRMRTHKFCTVLFSVTVDWYKQVDACCYQHTPAILIYWQLYISHVKIHVTSAAWCINLLHGQNLSITLNIPPVSKILVENHDFFITNLHLMPPLGGIAIRILP